MKQVVVNEPLLSVESGNDTDEQQSIWASILRDVKSSAKKAPTTKSLVVLGDNESGRTTLVAKLQGNDDPKRGAGLEYHYIDIKDDDQDDTPKLGVWILDGDVACSAPLLKFAMKSETLENTVLILVASMTQPWSLLSTLKKWTTLIEEHIDRLQIDPTRLREMRDRLQYDFQHYMEPNDSSTMLTSSASSTTIKSGVGGGRVPSSVSSVSLASTTPLSLTNGDEQVVLPLPDGVLTKSFGIPIIVVITKCDVMSTLEKENDYKDEHFDFMQHHLRKFCLEYGAALFYTSVKEKKNIDKLYKYIVHKSYGYLFTLSAVIVEREAIFIPAGWDNPNKADILLENLHRIKSTDNYSDVFVKPVTRRPLQRDNEIVMAEDDQEFLSKLQLTLNRAASPGRTDENATSVSTRTSGVSGGVGSQPTAAVGRSRPQSNATSASGNTATNEGALANFFNSLLTRKSSGAATPTGGSTPATQRQTSQSPTTPSSKRLQQHPLTFAVTPPLGRSRTPTPHKTFPSSLNVESPPKIVSPVVEKQATVENTSFISPTVVRTPLEDSKPVKTFKTTENEQSTITTVESPNFNHNQKQFNDALQVENEPITNEDRQNTESITSQHDSISNTKDNSNSETRIASPQSSPTTEKELNIKQIVPNDDTHQRLSNDSPLSQSITQDQESEIQQSPSFQSTVTDTPRNDEKTINNTSTDTQSRPISPSQHDELLNTENQSNVSLIDESRSSSLAAHDHNQLHDLSQSIDQKSSELSSSQTFENTQQLNDEQEKEEQIYSTTTKEEALEDSTEGSTLNNDEEQLTDTKPSLNSSCQNSSINSFITSQSSEDERTHLQPENELPTDTLPSVQLQRRSSSSDVVESALPIPSRSESHTILEPSESSLIYPVEDSQQASHTEQFDQAIIRTELPDNVSSTIQSPTLFSISNNSTIEEQQNQIFISDSNMNNNHDDFDSTNEMPNNSSDLPTTQETNSLTATDTEKSLDSSISDYPPLTPTTREQRKLQSTETNSTKTSTHEATLSSISSPELSESTQLIHSPTFDTHETKLHFFDNTAELPITDDTYEHGRSPSPTTTPNEQDATPLSAVTEPEQESEQLASHPPGNNQERSRSPSPFLQGTEQINQSQPSIAEDGQHRNRSPSPTTENKNEQSRSPSIVVHDQQQRGESSSPTTEKKDKGSRSSSPTIEQSENPSSPLSPAVDQNPESARSQSPTTQGRQQRSRSPSPIIHQSLEQSQPVSLTENDAEQKSQSPFPAVQDEQQRSESPLPITDKSSERSQSPSSASQEGEVRNRSPSPITQGKDEHSRSSSPVAQDGQRRTESPLPIADKSSERSQSPSSAAQQGEIRSRSPSPITQRKDGRSRSPSPVAQNVHQRTESPLPIADKSSERSQSLSSAAQEGEVRSRSPSPITQRKDGRSRSPSPVAQNVHQRTESPLPIADKSS
ncbi:unnamed protein product, partial [Rotaria sp. Silwood2]